MPNHPRRPGATLGVAIAASAVLLIAFFIFFSWFYDSRPGLTIVNGQQIQPGTVSFESGFAPVVQTALPSVVSITTTRVVRVEDHPLFDDPFFRRFFGDRMEPPPERRQQGLGSGVIVSREGHVLTNNHVIAGADDIQVVLDGRGQIPARVVGADPQTDIAVLQIEGEDLTPMALGRSADVRIGEFVLAIGNPFGVGRTVTMGIVSATGRGDLGIVGYEDFIQTDASINPGNSGGALLDQSGRLIGINTAILTGGRGFQGIGFAVPIDMARQVMEQVVQHGRVIRGFMGVSIQDVTPAVARSFGLDRTAGALVGDVTDGSPAARAGLRRGDVITEVNGEPVPDSRSLRLRVAAISPGTQVRLTVLRDGTPQQVTVTLGELPTEEVEFPQPPEEPDAGPAVLGLQVAELTAPLRRQLNIPPNVQGAVVARTQPGSPAAMAGLQRGDLIVEVNRRPVNNAAQVRQAIQATPAAEPVLLLIFRDGVTRYAAIER
jgi:serine protease Do